MGLCLTVVVIAKCAENMKIMIDKKRNKEKTKYRREKKSNAMIMPESKRPYDTTYANFLNFNFIEYLVKIIFKSYS